MGRLAILFVIVMAALSWSDRPGAALAQSTSAPSIAEQLRYVARDETTGMATAINERVIEEHEEAIEDYGEPVAEPVPPPPVDGNDVSRLAIPALGVDSPVGRYGLDAAGRLDVPADASTVGWHPAYGDLPGEGGSTFLVAHFVWGSQPGVFYELADLATGDDFTVTLSDGATHRYAVTSVLDYELGDIDMGAILAGLEGRESVILMTCSGPADEDFPFRTVVLAEPLD